MSCKYLGVIKTKILNSVPPAQQAAQNLEGYVLLWLATEARPVETGRIAHLGEGDCSSAVTAGKSGSNR